MLRGELKRQRPDENWQIVEYRYERSVLFSTKSIYKYSIYTYVGGWGPWQIINFYDTKSGTSINTQVSAEVIAAYCYGLLANAAV